MRIRIVLGLVLAAFENSLSTLFLSRPLEMAYECLDLGIMHRHGIDGPSYKLAPQKNLNMYILKI
jgi:hypothetical protein